MKRLEIPIEKQCAGGNKAVQGTFYKGLNVMSETGGLVVVDGEATSNWEVKGDNDKASTTIDAYQISSRFTVRYDGGTTDELLLASPFTIVEDPTVVTVQTFGPLESGEFKLTSSSVPLTVQYTCLQAGQSTITIGLTSDEDLNVKTIWSFTKTCQVAEAVEGVSLEGLMVGTEHGLSDVVIDGITTEEFRNAFNSDEENQKILTQVRADTDTMTFYVTSTTSNVGLRQPVLTIARTLSADFAHIVNPKVEGSLTRANQVKPGSELELSLVFNCLRSGISDVSVEIPLKPTGSLQFVVQKNLRSCRRRRGYSNSCRPHPGSYHWYSSWCC